VELGRDASSDNAFPVAILSPDGTRFVFVSTGSARRQLLLPVDDN
jgi:hypothetical protein